MTYGYYELGFVRYHHEYLNEIERLIAEGPEIFYQPSVIEKVEYNKALFYEKTTVKSFLKSMENMFVI
jgi:hypothetical protein